MAPPDYNESIPKTKLNMKRTFSFLTALLAIVSMMLCCNNCSKDDSGDNDTGKAMADYITMADETVDVTDGITLFDPVETWKKRTFTNVRAERLNRPIYVNGKRVYENPPLRDIRDFCAAQVATLWDEVTRFENPHRYYVDLSQKLWDERQRLLTEFGR